MPPRDADKGRGSGAAPACEHADVVDAEGWQHGRRRRSARRQQVLTRGVTLQEAARTPHDGLKDGSAGRAEPSGGWNEARLPSGTESLNISSGKIRMLFRHDILQGIAEGRVTLAVRRWRRAPPAD